MNLHVKQQYEQMRKSIANNNIVITPSEAQKTPVNIEYHCISQWKRKEGIVKVHNIGE
jgi:hypothetical protein